MSDGMIKMIFLSFKKKTYLYLKDENYRSERGGGKEREIEREIDPPLFGSLDQAEARN